MEDLEKLKIPDPEFSPDEKLRATILNTRTSARVGIALIILPAILLFTMIIKEELGINFGITNSIADLISTMDQSPYTHWMSPVLFGIFPLVAVIILMLSLIYISYDGEKKQLHFILKLRWKSIILLVICGGILGSITLYLVMENLGHLLHP